jgi:tetratricopeptide (TPR) repeat protein
VAGKGVGRRGDAFRGAVELGSTNPYIYRDYASVAQDAKKRIPLLQKAIALDPGYQEAHRYLAFCLLQDRQYQEAIDQLRQLKSIKAEQAFSYYHTWAYAALQLEKLDEAQKAAEAARKYARSPQDTSTAEDLLRAITNKRERREAAVQQPNKLAALPPGTPDEHDTDERPTIRRREQREEPKTAEAKSNLAPPPKPTVRGVLQQIDCLGKAVRLRVLADGKAVALAITDPQKVTVNGSPTATLDLTCGPQTAKGVILEYDPHADPKLGTSGIVTSIEFK